MPEQVMQEGDLDSIPVVDLVVLALRAPSPTRLELERAGDRRCFDFAQGQLIDINGTLVADSFIKVLTKRNKILAEEGKNLLRQVQETGKHILEILRGQSSLSVGELTQECRIWTTLLLVQSIGWNNGSYRILTLPTGTASNRIDFPVQVPAMLIKGVFKRMNLEEIEGLLEPYRDCTPAAVPAPDFSLESLELDEAKQHFVRSIDGKRTLSAVLEFSRLPKADGARMLYILQRLGLISFESSSPIIDTDAPARPARREASPQGSSVDMSSIRFNRSSRATSKSDTFHSGSPGHKESIGRSQSGPIRVGVEVGVGQSNQERSPAATAQQESTLAGIFDDMSLETGASTPPVSNTQPSPSVPPPPPPPPVSAPTRLPSSEAPQSSSTDPPPTGEGPVISEEDWDRLTTKDKERVRLLRTELNRLKDSNYFEYFHLNHESPESALKKGFFSAAKRYHPDSLLDEPPTYRALAEALFAAISEAWETLSSPELKDKYIRKHIFGEKDENDLAMEKVQKILDAETSFKNGLRLLNAGKASDAMRHFKRAHEDYEEEGEYLAYYAYTLFHGSRLNDPSTAERAIEMLKESINLSPNALKPQHLLGKVHILRGDGSAAKASLRKVLKLKADDAEALRDYKRASALSSQKGEAGGSSANRATKSGFFSRFGRKKPETPRKKSEEEKFLEDLDMDLDF
jgi:curved DNA-binding protein CbpA